MLDDTVQCCKEKVTCEVAVFPFYVRTVIHIPYNKAMLVRATNRDLISSGIGLLFTIETNVCSSITFFVCIKLIINNMCYVGCCKVAFLPVTIVIEQWEVLEMHSWNIKFGNF